MKRLLLSLGLCLIASSVVAEDCSKSPKLVSACLVIHGRASFGNGNPALRIWRVGTHHMYGVLPDETPLMPKQVIEALDGFNHSVFANYEVCPYTREVSGAMTMVCVQSASNLVVTKYRGVEVVRKKDHD